ncbi:MAG: RecX family transcriptional regulator [Bacteroidales bacterium]|nr:RecX family transcriptional regulator [Bacteroidales bacterium]
MTYEQALNRAAAYCSQAERATQEVLQKLEAWEVSDEDAARILEFLRKERFLDEQRYVHAFVNDKFTYERWGRIKIVYALRAKGVTGAVVNNTLDDVIDPDRYVETLTDLLRAKMRGMKTPLAPNDRAKLYRFAAQRGFESAVVGQALCQLNVPEEEE